MQKREKYKKEDKERKKAHDERRKGRRNPDNSGTTQLLYHNRLIDYEFS